MPFPEANPYPLTLYLIHAPLALCPHASSPKPHLAMFFLMIRLSPSVRASASLEVDAPLLYRLHILLLHHFSLCVWGGR
jgi:hypothetical protein